MMTTKTMLMLIKIIIIAMVIMIIIIIIIIIIIRQENFHILTLLLPFPVKKKGFSDHNEVHNLV